MSVDQARQTMSDYFHAMGDGADFAAFYTGDVRWVMIETGREAHGPAAVRNFVLALHGRMYDHRQRELVLADGHAYLEGDCTDRPGATEPRFVYCLVYDLAGDRIADMRCYGSIARLME
ncbi:nuclear transport factor 2 family protein [Actinoplanes sp. CA-030573]|uniref:nuclear transport factor 2 family protein n=1 Tax=Actinoplanes sp. CA-030573 TaxID=3239898 RepID=UPI003D90FDC4